MNKLVRLLNSVMRDQRGATAIEYGLIAVLVGIAIIGTVGVLGESVSNMYNYVAGEIEAI